MLSEAHIIVLLSKLGGAWTEESDHSKRLCLMHRSVCGDCIQASNQFCILKGYIESLKKAQFDKPIYHWFSYVR